jgi:hypothetical protein
MMDDEECVEQLVECLAGETEVFGFPRRSRFEPGSGHVGFVEDKATLEQGFFDYFDFPCQAFLPLLHTHHHPGLAKYSYASSGLNNTELGSTPPQISRFSFTFRVAASICSDFQRFRISKQQSQQKRSKEFNVTKSTEHTNSCSCWHERSEHTRTEKFPQNRGTPLEDWKAYITIVSLWRGCI